MIEVKSNSSLYKQIVWLIFVLIIVSIIAMIWDLNFSRNAIIAYVTLASFVLIAFISGTKINSIIIQHGNIIIDYHVWLRRRRFQSLISEINGKITQKTTFRGGTNTYLQLFKNDKLIFEIDQRDGFKEQDFKLITETLSGQ